MEERRRSPRFPVAVNIKGRIRSNTEVRVIDLSQHGMQLESEIGLPPNGTYVVIVMAPSGEKKLRAMVRRCRAHMTKSDRGHEVTYRSGLEFVQDDADSTTVHNLIAEICTVAGDTECAADDGLATGYQFAM